MAEARRTAKVIDPAAPSTSVVLKTTDSRQMKKQLGDIAADAVAFNCEVTIQVPRTDDYPWLSTLLAKRIVKVNPDVDLALRKVIARDQPAQVILKPAARN